MASPAEWAREPGTVASMEGWERELGIAALQVVVSPSSALFGLYIFILNKVKTFNVMWPTRGVWHGFIFIKSQ